MNLGIITDEPAEVYHSSGAIGSSMLAELDPCPLHFHGRHIAKTIPAKAKKPFPVGLALHYVMQGVNDFAENVRVHPKNYLGKESQKKDAPLVEKPWNWNATACDEWYQANSGKVILSPAESEIVCRMCEAIASSPDVYALLNHGKPEVTFRKNLGPFHVQCRADRWHGNGLDLKECGRKFYRVIVDLKTCETIERFKKDFCQNGYHFKAEYYRMIVREVLAMVDGVSVESVPIPDFVWVAVEKSAPYRCEFFEPDDDAISAGRAEVHAKLNLLSRCLRDNVWPGSKPGLQKIGLTSWQQHRSNMMVSEILEGAA